MTFVTSEPYIGHLGLNGRFGGFLRHAGACWLRAMDRNARTVAARDGVMTVEELDEDGNVKRTHSLPTEACHDAARLRRHRPCGPRGAGHPRGFVIVDEHQRNPVFRRFTPPGSASPSRPSTRRRYRPGCPRPGYMIEAMVRTLKATTSRRSWTVAPGHPGGVECHLSGGHGDQGPPSWPCRRSRRATSPGSRKGSGSTWPR